jgi:hypothetical protein
LARLRGCNSFLNSLKNVSNLNLNGDYKITKSNYSNTSINIYWLIKILFKTKILFYQNYTIYW